MNKMTAWMKGLLLLTLMVGGQAGAEVETVTYLHTDHLGSPIMGRDASGNTVFREEYGPWGQQLSATTPSEDVTYTGHANESDIGLTYMKARWYDPAVGRFLSPDPVTFDGGGAGHLNRYVYAGNSPMTNVDSTGQFEVRAMQAQKNAEVMFQVIPAPGAFEKGAKRLLKMSRIGKAANRVGAAASFGANALSGKPAGWEKGLNWQTITNLANEASVDEAAITGYEGSESGFNVIDRAISGSELESFINWSGDNISGLSDYNYSGIAKKAVGNLEKAQKTTRGIPGVQAVEKLRSRAESAD